MTTGTTIALTRQTFVGKVTALLFTVLSRLVIIFLPRGKLGYRWPFKEIVWVFFSLLLEVTRRWGFSPVPFACSAVESMRGVWVIGNLPEGWGAAFIAPVHVNRSGGGGWRAHTVLLGQAWSHHVPQCDLGQVAELVCTKGTVAVATPHHHR